MNTTHACRSLGLATLLSAFYLSASLSSGATFTVGPSEDAFLTTGPSGNLSGNNYGGAGALSVAASGKPQGEFQSVLAFSLAGARNFFNGVYGTGEWSVESVTLALTTVAPGNPLFNQNQAGQFNISWMANAGWAEGSGKPTAPSTLGITFNSLPNFLSPQDQSLGSFGFAGGTSGTATYNLNLGSGLVADILGGNNLSLRLNAADSSVSALFASRSNIRDSSGRPLLTIVAVPEPNALALGTIGFGIIFLVRFLKHIRT
jgi:hypothetical protein